MSAPGDALAPLRFDEAELPRFCADLPGCGGTLRATPEDFQVDEVLARPPSGRGAFAWVSIRKRGISTPELLRRLGAALGIRTKDLFAAGFKDAHAVTTQWIAMPGAHAAKLRQAAIAGVEVLSIAPADRTLAPADVAANRFVVTLRDVHPEAEARAQAVLARLASRGMPNHYGPQRFGVRGESAAVGQALLAGDAEAALAWILGRPDPREQDPRAAEFRAAFEQNDFAGAIASVPGRLRLERRLLERLARGARAADVVASIPRADVRFYLTAWQSLAFNAVLAARMRGPHADGAMPGSGVDLESDEAEAIARRGIDVGLVPRARGLGLPLLGRRRALFVPLRDPSLAARPEDAALVVRVSLPAGAFVTSLLHELRGPPIR